MALKPDDERLYFRYKFRAIEVATNYMRTSKKEATVRKVTSAEKKLHPEMRWKLVPYGKSIRRYKGEPIPRGYKVRFTKITKTAAEQLARGARSGRFGKEYDRDRAKVIKVGRGKTDYIVVIKKSMK